MRQRDEAVKKYNKDRTPSNESEAKRLRKEVIDTLKEEKRENGRKKLDALEREKDTGKIWGCIKSYLNWNKQSGAPTMLVDKNGKPETSPKRLAELQNDFYITKVSKIREVLPKGGEPLKVLQGMMKERQRPDITQNLEFRAVSPEEIDKILGSLKNSKSSGLDWIDTHILKMSKNVILPALTKIVNLSIKTNTFPTSWKNAKIVPLYKGKDANRTSPKSYRPVAILPIASKILERVIHNQILEHMEKNQFWHPNHHAYRKSRSTETAVL